MKIKERVQQEIEFRKVVLDFSGIINFTDDQLFVFCANNRELQIERSMEGKLTIMLPTGGEGSQREGTLFFFCKTME